jgi:EpsI family protein
MSATNPSESRPAERTVRPGNGGTRHSGISRVPISPFQSSWRGALVALFLVAQILVVHAALNSEHPPRSPALPGFPSAFGPWKLFGDDPIDSTTAKELGADLLVSQSYVRTPTGIGTPTGVEVPTGSFANLLVAWFQTQREGARQPHSPRVCLPGAGWMPRVVDQVTIDTAAGAIAVNRYIVEKDTQRAVILYWYQTPRRVTAGEWAAKFWLAADALLDKRTDTALVRVIVWPAGGGDQAAAAVAAGFVRSLYPALREYLPR